MRNAPMIATPVESQPKHEAQLTKALRSRSQHDRRAALEQLIRLPNCQAFTDEVERLCCKTRCRATWTLAKRTLFKLDPRRAVEMDKKHPFSEINEWKAQHVR